MLLPFGRSIGHIPAHRSLTSRFHTVPSIMKFSNYALAAAVLASTANAFAGSQMTPRFGLQVCIFYILQRLFTPIDAEYMLMCKY